MPLGKPSAPATFKIPRDVLTRLRAYSASSGLTLSAMSLTPRKVFDCDALARKTWGSDRQGLSRSVWNSLSIACSPPSFSKLNELLVADRVRPVGRASNEKRRDDHEARNDLCKGSSDKQKEEHTIASQTEALRAFALQRSRRGKRHRALQGSVNFLCGTP
jgi:hypothetical protein